MAPGGRSHAARIGKGAWPGCATQGPMTTTYPNSHATCPFAIFPPEMALPCLHDAIATPTSRPINRQWMLEEMVGNFRGKLGEILLVWASVETSTTMVRCKN